MKERFPVPRLVVCDQHGSQVTFIYFELVCCIFLLKVTLSFFFLKSDMFRILVQCAGSISTSKVKSFCNI
jgi:hypothetical protein